MVSCRMRTHQQIDQRSLAMGKAIVARIDGDPLKAGLIKAKATCQRWLECNPMPVYREWLEVLDKPWEEIRALLLDETELGQRLRQSDPFCGILTPQERWAIYRSFHEQSGT